MLLTGPGTAACITDTTSTRYGALTLDLLLSQLQVLVLLNRKTNRKWMDREEWGKLRKGSQDKGVITFGESWFYKGIDK